MNDSRRECDDCGGIMYQQDDTKEWECATCGASIVDGEDEDIGEDHQPEDDGGEQPVPTNGIEPDDEQENKTTEMEPALR